MPNLGVQKPTRVAALRSVLRGHSLPDRRTWEDTIRLLWDEATYREERYAATDLARYRTYREWATDPAALGLYEHMIVTGAWWDHVDEVAIKLVGPLLRAHPERVGAAMRRWSRDPNRWRRRASVICQIGSRDATDTALLAECILANVDDADFFLRKGVGWALREHAKTDPDWVRSFTTSYRGRLSPLSLREATRTLAPS
jgi:3-methyladenine DNA glycosylase AlkD